MCTFSAQLDYMVNELKRQNIHLKMMASVGGAKEESNPEHNVFEEIVKTDRSIQAFAESAATFVNNYKLDGIDIDWEFPEKEHAQQFTDLLQVKIFF